MKYLYQYLLFFVLLNSCHTKGQNENFGNSMDVKEVVPEGFCPFICQDNGMYITGLLNDTIDICLLFDTGADALRRFPGRGYVRHRPGNSRFNVLN